MPLEQDAVGLDHLVAERTQELQRVVARLQRELAERALVEAELRDKARALAEATERYEIVARMTSDAVYDWDLVTNQLKWGPGLFTLFGHQEGTFPGDFDWWAEQLHPDDKERVLLALEAAMAPEKGTWTREYRFRRGDGSYAVVFDRGLFLRNAEGKAVRMIGAWMDVTERRRMEQRLVFADRMASIGTLAAGVAHEINNPLTYTMTSQASALETLEAMILPSGKLPEATRETLAEVTRSLREAQAGTERVRRIIKDLKTFARAEDDGHLQPVDVRRVLDSALALVWNEIRHRATLEKHYGDVPTVRANEARLGQVFLNLLVNAAQAVPAGAVARNTISLYTLRDAQGRVCVEVRDTGPAVTPESQRRLFEPFFTTKGQAESTGTGTGLGLAICRSIIESLGGEIQVEGVPGTGSTFRVLLPPSPEETWNIVRPPEAVPVRVLVPDPQPNSEPIGPRGRVLIVDDEPLVRMAAARTLQSHHEVVEVSSGAAALARLEAGERYDAILCDLMMPELTGMELHAVLSRQIPDQADRMLFLTGGAFTAGAQTFLDNATRPALEKPFKAWQLRSAVAAVIAERGLLAGKA